MGRETRIAGFAFLAAMIGVVVIYVMDRRRAATELDQLRVQIAELESKAQESERGHESERGRAQPRTVIVNPPAPMSEERRPQAEQVDGERSGPIVETPAQKRERLKYHEFVTDEEREETYEKEWAAEPIEREWAYRTSEKIKQILVDGLNETSSLLSFKCRSSFCRVEMEHADPLDFKLYWERAYPMGSPLASMIGGARRSSVKTTERGTLRVVWFIAKQGVPIGPIRPELLKDAMDPGMQQP